MSDHIKDFREFCIERGISAEDFDRAMQLQVPTLDALKQMHDDGLLHRVIAKSREQSRE